MAGNLQKHLNRLSKRGPHRVLVGDLDFVGIPGVLYTPAEGNGIPAVAFGHDWMASVKDYHRTLRHLASWGIAVAAPQTERTMMANHRGFAADLETCLQILAGVKLGEGNVTVAPGKLGLAGHGMGAGCAVLAAAGNEKVKAVASIFPAKTSPNAYSAAKRVEAPGLVIGSAKDSLVDAGNPARYAANWAGDCVYREVDNGNQFGFTENLTRKLLLGIGLPDYSAQETIRGLVTGFLLHELAGERKYSAFADPTAEAKHVLIFDDEEIAEKADLSKSQR
ncbi:dienelactone hydrolase family protein [Corynebacterium choanae]|uniref:Alpha/beta hydrolase family protein n=1 Tax=Corynebacterium choanae TaxID=1862358 RepID=A0A3G6J835_9CORY|nr:dienelactone hydrolase family protein [Corynebacterium choanae]AZA14265.1 Alpha/beta hydrolase family protein [Corynebacterium choanae]